MSVRIFGVQLEFTFWFFALLAGAALLNKEALALYFLLPIAVHELGHLLALAVLRIKVRSIGFTAMGVNILREKSETLRPAGEALICAAGILANLLLALMIHLFRYPTMRMMFLVAANLAVAAFNLLPIGDLDGGQLLRLLTARRLPPSAARMASKAASLAALAALFGLAIFLAIHHNPNPTLLVTSVYLAVNVILRD